MINLIQLRWELGNMPCNLPFSQLISVCVPIKIHPYARHMTEGEPERGRTTMVEIRTFLKNNTWSKFNWLVPSPFINYSDTCFS